MDRIRAANASPTPPADMVTTNPAGHFQPGTTVTTHWAEGVTESLVQPLEDGNVTPDINGWSQFAALLTGIHGIITSIRTNLATTGASTYIKQVAIAATGAIVRGLHSVVIAGNNAFNGGDNAVVFGPHCENHANNRVAFGWGAGAITYQGADQNINAYVDLATGDIVTIGDVTVKDLHANGNALIDGTLEATGAATLKHRMFTMPVVANLGASGLVSVVSDWADYDDEQIIKLEITATPDQTGRVISDGKCCGLNLPAALDSVPFHYAVTDTSLTSVDWLITGWVSVQHLISLVNPGAAYTYNSTDPFTITVYVFRYDVAA